MFPRSTLYLVTPTLGFIRNYIKYKQCNFGKFIRTPLIYCLFHIFFYYTGQKNILFKTLICERWFFFIDKSFISFMKDDYNRNKLKYEKKYNINYSPETIS